ncbi:MAG: hypothetical protein MAG451_02836 [Anaerolineales bacterium]|nr:hypothetical protein [Anaerolineales bacterium]
MRKSRSLAFLAYLLSILGWFYVLLFHKKDKFAVYHAKQSVMLTIFAVATPMVWALISWILAWIPLVGSVVAATLFSLVIAAYILLGAAWIVGMVYALQAKRELVPVVGGWAERFFIGSEVV